MTQDQFTLRLLYLKGDIFLLNNSPKNRKNYVVFNFVVCKNVMVIEAAYALSHI